MPFYCYKCLDCGASTELVRPISQCKRPAICTTCGGVAHRDIVAEHSTTFHAYERVWPLPSNAMACLDDGQMKASMELDKAKGVPTEYDAKRRPVFTSAQHKKKYLEAHGYRDPTAGFTGAMGKGDRMQPVGGTGPSDRELKESILRNLDRMGLRRAG